MIISRKLGRFLSAAGKAAKKGFQTTLDGFGNLVLKRGDEIIESGDDVGLAARTIEEGIGVAYRSFIKSNFRHNLGQFKGFTPDGHQAHHVFPQKFEADFANAGINVHNPLFGAWWESSSHLSNASDYNSRWQAFLNTNPSQNQIFEFGRNLMSEYNIPVSF